VGSVCGAASFFAVTGVVWVVVVGKPNSNGADEWSNATGA